jgi:Domain of unknown function (DUF4157)
MIRATMSSHPPAMEAGPILQRKCASCECESCRKKKQEAMQRKGSGPLPSQETPAVAREALRSPGQPLDGNTRRFMESRFQYDFSRVRVHANDAASRGAQAVNALAYTVGTDIVFGSRQYQPETMDGRRLLAHELTHVVQQQTGRAASMQRQSDEDGDDSLEQEADQTATAVAAGAGEDAGRAIAAPKKGYPGCTRTILFENTCAGLVHTSAWHCCDPDKGIEDKTRTTGKNGECPSQKWTPIFTCDHDCDTAIKKGCSDNDNWMAIPPKQFSMKNCGDQYTICANGKKTSAYVRDKSVSHRSFEVGPGVQKALGLPVGGSFKGAVYKPDVKQSTIDKDPCCGGKP